MQLLDPGSTPGAKPKENTVLSQELFSSGEFHATWVLLSVTAGSGMAARHTGHVDRTGPLFHSDYRDLLDTPEKDLPFD